MISNAEPSRRGDQVPGPDDAAVRELLKRCSAATGDAAIRFRRSGHPDLLPAIIRGVIEHYVEPGVRAKLHPGGDELRLAEDLGLDSLTLMEIALFLEDVLLISIGNEELDAVRTIGDMRQLILSRLGGMPAPPAPAAPWLIGPKTSLIP
jgi:3-hydroxyacyl-[acyl-carrier-protein] dehydratase